MPSGGPSFTGYTLLIIGITTTFVWCFHTELMSEDSLSAVVRNIGLVSGGLIAIGLAVWRSAIAERQAITANKQIILAEKQAESSRTNLLYERYQRALELLSHDESYIRIGGMHAIQNLATSNPGLFAENALTTLRAYQELGVIPRTEQREMTHTKESKVAERVIEYITTVQHSKGIDEYTFYDKATLRISGTRT